MTINFTLSPLIWGYDLNFTLSPLIWMVMTWFLVFGRLVTQIHGVLTSQGKISHACPYEIDSVVLFLTEVYLFCVFNNQFADKYKYWMSKRFCCCTQGFLRVLSVISFWHACTPYFLTPGLKTMNDQTVFLREVRLSRYSVFAVIYDCLFLYITRDDIGLTYGLCCNL